MGAHLPAAAAATPTVGGTAPSAAGVGSAVGLGLAEADKKRLKAEKREKRRWECTGSMTYSLNAECILESNQYALVPHLAGHKSWCTSMSWRRAKCDGSRCDMEQMHGKRASECFGKMLQRLRNCPGCRHFVHACETCDIFLIALFQLIHQQMHGISLHHCSDACPGSSEMHAWLSWLDSSSWPDSQPFRC